MQQIVHEMFTKKERMKFSYPRWKLKTLDPNIAAWHKLLIHMAYNIGPSKAANEDIDEIKEEEADENASQLDQEVEENNSSLMKNTEGLQSSLNLARQENDISAARDEGEVMDQVMITQQPMWG